MFAARLAPLVLSLIVLSGLPAAAKNAAASPPGSAALAFGKPAKDIDHVLGKPLGLDNTGDFLWRSYALDKGQIRVGFYHDRVSTFMITPGKPMTWPQASGWAAAFMPGFEQGRQVRQDPAKWMVFKTFVLFGRPFEAQLEFDRAKEQITSMSGEIHWLD